MLLLLPPSETKRDGGEGGALDLGELSHPELDVARAEAMHALVAGFALDLDDVVFRETRQRFAVIEL